MKRRLPKTQLVQNSGSPEGERPSARLWANQLCCGTSPPIFSPWILTLATEQTPCGVLARLR